MATARRCSGCGASLGEPTDDDLTVVCRFCGLRHDLNDLAGAGAATVVVQLSPGVRRTNVVGRGFGDRPFYTGYLIYLPREGWAWYFSAPSGNSFPRVRARDARVYQY